ncbi:MAG: caspase family protein [Phaeospirillum sp.]|nr:caspase family protein [Phaeospirillum sp.]
MVKKKGACIVSSSAKAIALAVMVAIGVPTLAAAGQPPTLEDFLTPEEQFSNGLNYAIGKEVPKDEEKAARLFRKAAESGLAHAQHNLGVMYENGRGVPQDYAEAVKWYRKAADQGYATAQFNLGGMSYNGQGVPQDYAEAVRCYRKAADQGNAEAQYNLGIMYQSGQGVPQDYAEAVKWYRKAADQGNAGAQYNLGVMYKNGRGVPQDYAEAVKWYRKAADQGDAHAQARLAASYGAGLGVPQDFTWAYRWISLAASRFSASEIEELEKATKRRDQTAALLTQAQIAKAQQWVRNWKPVSAVKESTPSTPSPLPTQKSQKTVPAAPQTLPVISTSSTLQTLTESVEISGRVSGGTLSSLTVEGRAAPFKPDGSFSFRRAVPIGESDIRLIATNEWGQNAEATIKVSRSVVATIKTEFPPLDPGRLHGKPRPNAIALIIGIEQYKSVPPAEFAENDARRFYDYATNALGVPASRVKLLTGADAQRVDVEAAILTWLKPQVVKGQTEVFVFFSGHGLASDDGKDLYLLPQDGNRALLDRSALRRKELIDMIVDSGPKSATLFLDTCYSGGTRGKETLISSARPILVAAKEQAVPPNVTILAAAGNDQLSSSLAQAKHGLFSYFLMKGLEGDAAGSDRTITAAKLEAYLSEKIPAEAAKLGRTQTPQLIGDGSRVVSSW